MPDYFDVYCGGKILYSDVKFSSTYWKVRMSKLCGRIVDSVRLYGYPPELNTPQKLSPDWVYDGFTYRVIKLSRSSDKIY